MVGFLYSRKERQMATGNALLWAVCIALISCTLLNFMHGVPSSAKLVMYGTEMFFVAFIILKLWGGDRISKG
jgi:hypothetical protein